MLRIRTLIVLAAILCATVFPSYAVTLQPGVYKLELQTIGKTDFSEGKKALDGTIKTDTGEIPVSFFDGNYNGTYTDRMQLLPDYLQSVRSADGIYIGGDQWNAKTEILWLAGAEMFHGKLYTFDISPTGDALKVDTYKGDTGTVKFDAVDGNGKPTRVKYVSLYGVNGSYRSEEGSKTITIPAGYYKCGFVCLQPKPGPTKFSGFMYKVLLGAPVTVQKNKVTDLKLGGLLRMVYHYLGSKGMKGARNPINENEELRELRAARGSGIRVEMAMMLGEVQVHEVTDLPVTIEYIDESGKVVKSDKTRFGHSRGGTGMTPFYIDLRMVIPNDWQPGTYKVRATADTLDYQGVISSEYSLIIE